MNKSHDAALVVGLNEAQARAVTSTHGRMLLVAGAGAGKTTVLARRVVALILRGVPPEFILCVTFTRKTAGEMEDRITALLATHKPGARIPEIRTLHAWGAQMIRRYSEHFGLTHDFSIYDETDREDVIRMVARERQHKGWERSRLDTLLREQALRDAYAERLLAGNAIDFDTIERYALRLLEEHPEVKTRWTRFYRHALVDEYQDTNLAQVAILSNVAPDNLCVIGDPRQCQPAGSLVLTPSGWRAIETLRTGDEVCGWDRRTKHVYRSKGSPVVTACRSYTGRLYTVVTETGRRTTTTDTHRWLTRWDPTLAAELSAVYVMHSTERNAYRMGWCKVLDESGGFTAQHYKQRAAIEGADALWLVELHRDRGNASIRESILSTIYTLPLLMFRSAQGNLLYTQDRLDRAWTELARHSRIGFKELARVFGIIEESPHFRRGQPRGRQTLFECVSAHLREGMMVPIWDGEVGYRWERIAKVEVAEVTDEPVWSLDVERHHSYVTDGSICTLNSIYRFRGAEVQTIVDHARDAAFEVIELTTNYRSLPGIVAFGNGCVDGDWTPMESGRPNPVPPCEECGGDGFELFSLDMIEDGWTPTNLPPCHACKGSQRVVTAHTFRSEPPLVAGLIRDERARGTRYGEIAVLARNWAAIEDIHENLRAAGVPVNFCGADADPWTSEDGRAMARALILSGNTADDNLTGLLSEWGALGRRRFPLLGEFRAMARRARASLLKTLGESDPEWGRVWARLQRVEGGWTLVDHVRAFLDGLGVLETYAERGLVSRIATVNELLGELAKRGGSLEEFREWWIGRTTADRIEESRDAVRLMTIHAAKGLEFKVVVLADCRAGVFPTDRVKATPADLAEDLRVFYVGVTRARDRLYCTFPLLRRDLWTGAVDPVTPSAYLSRPGGPGKATEWKPPRWGGSLPARWSSPA